MGKNKPEETSAVYDPEERKNFLTRINHSKEIKRKNAIKRAEIALREERKERHKLKKEKADQFAHELMEKQQKLGISPLDIIAQGPSAIIPTFEVNVEKQTTSKQEQSESKEEVESKTKN